MDNKVTPPFAFPVMFAEIAGISAKEARRLCRQHIIPSEKTRKGFRIDVEAGLAVLKDRAATFAGHGPLPPNYRCTGPQPQAAGPRAKEASFFAALDALKGGRS